MKNSIVEWAWKIAGLHSFFAKTVAGMGFRREGTYLSETGWYRSFQKRVPIDRYGRPIPWYNYPTIRFLQERAQPDWEVFEYGCGNSTLWWSDRVAHVESCEHNASWYERMKKNLPSNAVCHLKKREDYASFITGFSGRFHVVVIDGINRVECAHSCLEALRDDGVVIWDNSDREEYQAGFSYLADQGFRRLDFEGLGPIVMIPTATTVFYRRGNCLGL